MTRVKEDKELRVTNSLLGRGDGRGKGAVSLDLKGLEVLRIVLGICTPWGHAGLGGYMYIYMNIYIYIYSEVSILF